MQSLIVGGQSSWGFGRCMGREGWPGRRFVGHRAGRQGRAVRTGDPDRVQPANSRGCGSWECPPGLLGGHRSGPGRRDVWALLDVLAEPLPLPRSAAFYLEAW